MTTKGSANRWWPEHPRGTEGTVVACTARLPAQRLTSSAYGLPPSCELQSSKEFTYD